MWHVFTLDKNEVSNCSTSVAPPALKILRNHSTSKSGGPGAAIQWLVLLEWIRYCKLKETQNKVYSTLQHSKLKLWVKSVLNVPWWYICLIYSEWYILPGVHWYGSTRGGPASFIQERFFTMSLCPFFKISVSLFQKPCLFFKHV